MLNEHIKTKHNIAGFKILYYKWNGFNMHSDILQNHNQIKMAIVCVYQYCLSAAVIISECEKLVISGNLLFLLNLHKITTDTIFHIVEQNGMAPH